ncbi:unnamed protein product [Nippostrongylus brasiliensis]|uniref:Transmembrane protein n=1 Tax=Nippostrongylus brasiliensis TaxID=27835 RepID=A0A0N4XJ78_NIPBR|nr:unnamed protein product [Nippostrongylus brasiliensis]
MKHLVNKQHTETNEMETESFQVNRPQPLLYRHSAGVSRRQSRVLATLQSKRKRSNSLTNYQKTYVRLVRSFLSPLPFEISFRSSLGSSDSHSSVARSEDYSQDYVAEEDETVICTFLYTLRRVFVIFHKFYYHSYYFKLSLRFILRCFSNIYRSYLVQRSTHRDVGKKTEKFMNIKNIFMQYKKVCPMVILNADEYRERPSIVSAAIILYFGFGFCSDALSGGGWLC